MLIVLTHLSQDPALCFVINVRYEQIRWCDSKMPASTANMDVAVSSRPPPMKRRKSMKKKLDKALVGSPMERQLRETETWTLPELDMFVNLPTARERVEFIYSILPPDATSLDRLWPIQVPQKDSRSVNDNKIRTPSEYVISTI